MRDAPARETPPHVAWSGLNERIAACALCPRLREHCLAIAVTKRKSFNDQAYWGKPVPNFGDPKARILVVGLAPAAHGGNRTGQMFTGDRSGEWLFRSLHRAGLASQPGAESRFDGLKLIDCAITAAAHCAPPQNKPTVQELALCQPFLAATLDAVPARAIVALGQIAWKAILAEARRRAWLAPTAPKFAHGAEAPLSGDRALLASYHPSQQNTFTGRLTEPMLDEVILRAREIAQLA
jgi:uracil-DNA glycosylase family 4